MIGYDSYEIRSRLKTRYSALGSGMLQPWPQGLAGIQ